MPVPTGRGDDSPPDRNRSDTTPVLSPHRVSGSTSRSRTRARSRRRARGRDSLPRAPRARRRPLGRGGHVVHGACDGRSRNNHTGDAGRRRHIVDDLTGDRVGPAAPVPDHVPCCRWTTRTFSSPGFARDGTRPATTGRLSYGILVVTTQRTTFRPTHAPLTPPGDPRPPGVWMGQCAATNGRSERGSATNGWPRRV